MPEAGDEPAQLLVDAECLLKPRENVVRYVPAGDFQAVHTIEPQLKRSADLVGC